MVREPYYEYVNQDCEIEFQGKTMALIGSEHQLVGMVLITQGHIVAVEQLVCSAHGITQNDIFIHVHVMLVFVLHLEVTYRAAINLVDLDQSHAEGALGTTHGVILCACTDATQHQ